MLSLQKEGTFEEGLLCTLKQEKGKEKVKEEKQKSSVKIEEINAISKNEGDILLNSTLDAAHMVPSHVF